MPLPDMQRAAAGDCREHLAAAMHGVRVADNCSDCIEEGSVPARLTFATFKRPSQSSRPSVCLIRWTLCRRRRASLDLRDYFIMRHAERSACCPHVPDACLQPKHIFLLKLWIGDSPLTPARK